MSSHYFKHSRSRIGANPPRETQRKLKLCVWDFLVLLGTLATFSIFHVKRRVSLKAGTSRNICQLHHWSTVQHNIVSTTLRCLGKTRSLNFRPLDTTWFQYTLMNEVAQFIINIYLYYDEDPVLTEYINYFPGLLLAVDVVTRQINETTIIALKPYFQLTQLIPSRTHCWIPLFAGGVRNIKKLEGGYRKVEGSL